MTIKHVICIFLAGIGLLLASCNSQPGEAATAPLSKAAADSLLRIANDEFYAALNENFTGNTGPLEAAWSHGEDVSDQGPFGARLDGWTDVYEEFKKEAAMKLGGKVVCKDLIVRSGGDMGYTACIEEGQNMSAEGKPVVVRFRATNIFRLENGAWKMVHHHTDLSAPLQDATGTNNDATRN